MFELSSSIRPTCAKPRILASASALLSVCLAVSVYAQESYQVDMQDGLLSIKADNVSAIELADALSRETGIKFSVQGDTVAKLSADISDEKVDKAIAKLSPNHLLVHESKALNADILEIILIVSEGGTQASANGDFLPSGAPADVIEPAEPTAAAASPDDGSTAPLRDQLRRLNSRAVGESNPAGAEATDETANSSDAATPATQQQ